MGMKSKPSSLVLVAVVSPTRVKKKKKKKKQWPPTFGGECKVVVVVSVLMEGEFPIRGCSAGSLQGKIIIREEEADAMEDFRLESSS